MKKNYIRPTMTVYEWSGVMPLLQSSIEINGMQRSGFGDAEMDNWF